MSMLSRSFLVELFTAGLSSYKFSSHILAIDWDCAEADAREWLNSWASPVTTNVRGHYEMSHIYGGQAPKYISTSSHYCWSMIHFFMGWKIVFFVTKLIQIYIKTFSMLLINELFFWWVEKCLLCYKTDPSWSGSESFWVWCSQHMINAVVV